MCRTLGTISLVLFLAIGTGFGPPALLESDEALMPLYQYQTELVRGASAKPSVNAASAIVVDGASGKAVYEKNARVRLAPASTTKIMTAVVALERGRLDDLVTIDVDGWALAASTGSSVMGLSVGEVLTLEDLLYGLMLPSGNDAALAIARHIGGTESEFARMMNEKAAQLGLKDTHFVNPHGLDDDEHYSSAYDLARIGRYAMSNPVLAGIVAAKVRAVHGKKADYTLVTGNRLLGRYEGADGVKTGYTEAAGQSFVASVTRGGRRVFVALIQSSDRLSDAEKLFDYAFENFEWVKLALPKSPFNLLIDVNGVNRELVADTGREEVVARWQAHNLRRYVWLQEVPDLSGGGHVGSTSFYLGDAFLGEFPTYAK